MPFSVRPFRRFPVQSMLFQFQLNKPINMSLAVSEVTYGTTGTWA